MRWLDDSLGYLFPHSLVAETPWGDEWQKQEKDAFVRNCQIAYLLIGIGYLANFFFFDVPMGLEPIEYWAAFRGSMVALCLSTSFYYQRLGDSVNSWFRVPGIFMALVFCHSQAWVTIFYGKEAWVFFFFFVIGTCIVLRLTSFQSFAWCVLVTLVSTPVLLAGEVGLQNLMSGMIVATFSSVIIRASVLSEVRLFLANQKHDEAQQQLLNLSAEYADRVKTFIPRVIADRLTDLMDRQRMNVVEASIEALKSKKKVVSCLFTDIRGFTQGSKDLDGFIIDSVLPEVASCSDAIEELQGIPRKIGDLIFAYFDEDLPQVNAARSMMAGYEIARINESMNMRSSSEIKRYILISSGEAMVGNFGGLDTSIEITALGSPVNFLSRIDELTKEQGLAQNLSGGDLVFDEATLENLVALGIDIDFMKVDLEPLGLSIRDFPEVTHIYLHSPSDRGYEALSSALENYVER